MPAITNPSTMTTPGLARNVNAGGVVWYSQRREPSLASRPKMRLSPLRTTTYSSDACGALSTSLDTLECHNGLPARSKASTEPFDVPTRTMFSPMPTPPDSTDLVSILHVTLPFAAFPCGAATWKYSEVEAVRRPGLERSEVRPHLHDRGHEPEADQADGENRSQYCAAVLRAHLDCPPQKKERRHRTATALRISRRRDELLAT